MWLSILVIPLAKVRNTTTPVGIPAFCGGVP
jgi:hypothetical protein